jgi:hypothetical protein
VPRHVLSVAAVCFLQRDVTARPDGFHQSSAVVAAQVASAAGAVVMAESVVMALFQAMVESVERSVGLA